VGVKNNGEADGYWSKPLCGIPGVDAACLEVAPEMPSPSGASLLPPQLDTKARMRIEGRQAIQIEAIHLAGWLASSMRSTRMAGPSCRCKQLIKPT
jgi:hypothetical protein